MNTILQRLRARSRHRPVLLPAPSSSSSLLPSPYYPAVEPPVSSPSGYEDVRKELTPITYYQEPFPASHTSTSQPWPPIDPRAYSQPFPSTSPIPYASSSQEAEGTHPLPHLGQLRSRRRQRNYRQPSWAWQNQPAYPPHAYPETQQPLPQPTHYVPALPQPALPPAVVAEPHLVQTQPAPQQRPSPRPGPTPQQGPRQRATQQTTTWINPPSSLRKESVPLTNAFIENPTREENTGTPMDPRSLNKQQRRAIAERELNNLINSLG